MKRVVKNIKNNLFPKNDFFFGKISEAMGQVLSHTWLGNKNDPAGKGMCLGVIGLFIEFLCAETVLFGAETCADHPSASMNPMSWILIFVILFLIFLNSKNTVRIQSLLRVKAAVASLPVQFGVCDANGNIFFYKDSSGFKTDLEPKRLQDLNMELWHELQKVLPVVFESNMRKSIEFNCYSTQYKIDFFPLPQSDYGVATVLWIVHDVSDLTKAFDERMQMFRLLQNTLSSIDDAVISTNCDGEITLLNPSAARMAGRSKVEMQGKPLDNFFRLRDEKGESLVKKVMLTHNSFPFHSELKINDHTLFVDGLITPIIEDNLIVGTVLYFHDTTELVQQDRKLQLALKFAQVSDRVKSDFLATVCHEFRSSINVIIGYCDLNRANGAVGDSHIGNIHDEAEKLLYMFNDILDVSKNNTDSTGLVQEPVNLNVFTREMQRIFSRTSGLKKVPLIVQIDPKVPVILSDYKGLRQIFMQLLTQAYSLVRGDSVIMSIKWIEQNLIIGISIDSPKVRINQDLSVYDRLCERFNGELNIRQTGDHLSFELFLEKPKIVGKTTSLTLPDLANLQPRPKKNVVILVDDIAINLKLLATMLKMMNIESVSCTTAREVMEEISKYEPKAIFMDLWMPDVGGEELADVLSRNPNTASIPRILMTADTQLDAGLKKLFLFVIYKPLRPADLQSALDLIEKQNIKNM